MITKKQFNATWRLVPRGARDVAWRIFENHGPQNSVELAYQLRRKSPATALAVMTIFASQEWINVGSQS